MRGHGRCGAAAAACEACAYGLDKQDLAVSTPLLREGGVGGHFI